MIAWKLKLKRIYAQYPISLLNSRFLQGINIRKYTGKVIFQTI